MREPDNDEIAKDMLIDKLIDETEMCKSCGDRMQHIDGNWICKSCGFEGKNQLEVNSNGKGKII